MFIDQVASLVRLDDAECRRLLATAHVGRLGFTDGALPAIVPVPVALHEGSVFIRGRRGGSTMSAISGAVVALEVDSYRDEVGAGWSITVVGPARVIRHPTPVAEVDALGLFPADRTAPHSYAVVLLALVRGWRAGRAATVDHVVDQLGR